MANPEHVEIVKGGPKAIYAWREKNPVTRLDLEKANLAGINLQTVRDVISPEAGMPPEIDIIDTQANLNGADLRGAGLEGANLIGVNFRDADLVASNLFGALLFYADLAGANLRTASLLQANLHATRLSMAIMTEVRCGGTGFIGLDLSDVIGLETVIHNFPSSVDIDTLYRSGGKIPAVFLRGCGVPDGLITYLPSLISSQEAIQFYSCFISYNHMDDVFVKHLFQRMQKDHLRVWYASENIQGGKKIYQQIDQAIRIFDKLLLVLSKHSMASEWVKTEIYKARQREIHEGRRMLFPIRLVDFKAISGWECFDSDSGKDLAREIREYFIPDFSDWRENDSFEAAYARLLNDLRTGETAK